MKISSVLGAIVLAASVQTFAAQAVAETLDVTIHWRGGATETFAFDPTAGHADDLSSDFIYFNISNDSLGLNAIFFGDDQQNGEFGTGTLSGNHVVAPYYDYFHPNALYSGSGLTVSLTPGVTYSAQFGSTLTAVPEPSTWGLMLTGFAGLGFAFYRRNKGAALAA